MYGSSMLSLAVRGKIFTLPCSRYLTTHKLTTCCPHRDSLTWNCVGHPMLGRVP